MNIRLDGKRALVTGGNSGIGKAIVTALAAAGARVAINYVTHSETAEELVRSITAQYGDAVALAADVSDADAVHRMFTDLDSAFGGIDILVNNAGIDGVQSVTWEAELAGWRKVIDINLFGALYCSREALQRMVPHGSGVIVTTTSVHEDNNAVWSDPAKYKDLLAKIPLDRLGEPADIANMVVVLVSDVAGYLTGRTVFVDGGMTDYPSFAHGG